MKTTPGTNNPAIGIIHTQQHPHSEPHHRWMMYFNQLSEQERRNRTKTISSGGSTRCNPELPGAPIRQLMI